ncbi:uncharacterized protein LOC131246419 isoform X3 [Magnolia sinica]|uniref:uncharacterized protein LOC131246419 isoform X3 n=1 Tax=Magnolia sinica TaxID=86752 RepID=UPI002657FF12|nr:uncharacterized protein LOC131246419 isoform X3 [Magnolia sinica]
MAFHLPAAVNVQIGRCDMRTKGRFLKVDACFGYPNDQTCKAGIILCSASRGRRGFGSQPSSKEKGNNAKAPREGGNNSSQDSQQRKSTSRKSDTIIDQAPGLASGLSGTSRNVVSDRQFEERLEVVRRSALEQKKAEENKTYQAIDYDAPVESDQGSIGLGTKVGVGIAVVVFGLVFALGDFLPSESVGPNDSTTVEKKLTDEEKATLQNRLQQFEATLKISPKDPDAIEERPKDSDAYRLLGEIKYELKDYDGSVAAYRRSASASETINLEVLRGLTNALLAAKKPDEAVQLLLASREFLNSRSLDKRNIQVDGNSNLNMEMQDIDPIQVELLLAKAYSDWGHVSDAVSVYDRLISMYPDDFRGYLAKGIILKENGKVGDAERMFIQARFFAPEKAKALVDRYSRQ